MNGKPEPLKVAAPLDSVDWTRLPVGSKFRYWSEKKSIVASNVYTVRGPYKGGGLWVTRPRATSSGFALKADGSVDNGYRVVGHILPETIKLPANTRKAIDEGLDLSWLPSGTLIQDGLDRTYVIVAPRDGDEIDNFPIRADRFDPAAEVFVAARAHTAGLLYMDHHRSTRMGSDFRSETAILPSMWRTGGGVWPWEDGRLICHGEADVVVSAEADEFLSWEAAL